MVASRPQVQLVSDEGGMAIDPCSVPERPELPLGDFSSPFPALPLPTFDRATKAVKRGPCTCRPYPWPVMPSEAQTTTWKPASRPNNLSTHRLAKSAKALIQNAPSRVVDPCTSLSTSIYRPSHPPAEEKKKEVAEGSKDCGEKVGSPPTLGQPEELSSGLRMRESELVVEYRRHGSR